MTRTAAAITMGCCLAAASAAGAAEAKTFGRPLRGLKSTPLADVLARPVAGQTVRIEGTVQAVCQSKGCWMEVKQGDAAVHVTFEGYSFFLPKDATGKRAALEGKVIVKRPAPEDIEHLQNEGAGDAASARVAIEATGVELR